MTATALQLTDQRPKHAGGRPTDYRPEFCEMVTEHLQSGLSLTAFAGVLLVSRQTVYEWMRVHREFSDAVKRGQPARQLWWERRLQTVERGGEVAASIFALKNISPDEWRDVRSVNHQHRVTSTMTDAELYAIAAGEATGPVIEGEYEAVPSDADGR